MTNAEDLFADDPMSQPLTYPGRIPQTSGVLTGNRYVRLHAPDGEPASRWRAEVNGVRPTLAEFLGDLGVTPLEGRHRVVAVGSNGAPSQLYRKFVNHGARAAIPMTRANVTGIAPGVSAHINRNGYVPAAPIEIPEKAHLLFVLWLDDEQLSVLDATEPNYHRRLLPPGKFPIKLASGVGLPACHIYVGKHGYLVDRAGVPFRLGEQAELIRQLLTHSSALRRLCGNTPEEFISHVQDEAVRKLAYAIFRKEGLARPQLDFLSLPTETPSPNSDPQERSS
ncbi:hypothetical protein ACFYY8_25700 [Streptosporangium sp. NPDC001559]|uniref:hypothetical protein n=1 Tax=Streptosporangium sp. NPDC001559 TaxID=3366187 RepID=UPI0036E857BB